MFKKLVVFIKSLFINKTVEEPSPLVSGILLLNGKNYFFIRNNGNESCYVYNIVKIKGACVLKLMPLTKGVVGVSGFNIEAGEEVVFLVKPCKCDYTASFKLLISYKLSSGRVGKIYSSFFVKNI